MLLIQPAKNDRQSKVESLSMAGSGGGGAATLTTVKYRTAASMPETFLGSGKEIEKIRDFRGPIIL